MSQAQKISIAILPGETHNISADDLIISKLAPTEQMASIQVLLNEGVSRKCHKWRRKKSSKYLSPTQQWLSLNEKWLEGAGRLAAEYVTIFRNNQFLYEHFQAENVGKKACSLQILNLPLFNFLLSVLVQNSVCYKIVSILLKIIMTRKLSSTLKK